MRLQCGSGVIAVLFISWEVFVHETTRKRTDAAWCTIRSFVCHPDFHNFSLNYPSVDFAGASVMKLGGGGPGGGFDTCIMRDPLCEEYHIVGGSSMASGAASAGLEENLEVDDGWMMGG